VTGTVASIPLISSSIMSKKIAEGTGALILDVKYGSGAFMAEPERARLLAHTMVRLGDAHGVKTIAQLTPMKTPLGRAVGNALEVTEALEVLHGDGPPDVRALTIDLASLMLGLVGLDADPVAALDDGSAYEVYRRMIAAQGGDPDAPMPTASFIEVVAAHREGFVRRVDALAVGVAAWRLGAGRARKEDPVSATAGVLCLVREGDHVGKGQPLFELHADDDAHLDLGREAMRHAVEIGDEPRPLDDVVVDLIRS
jgi:thymidine phosphorylase